MLLNINSRAGTIVNSASWPKMSSSSYVKIKADIDSIYLEDKDDEAVPSQ